MLVVLTGCTYCTVAQLIIQTLFAGLWRLLLERYTSPILPTVHKMEDSAPPYCTAVVKNIGIIWEGKATCRRHRMISKNPFLDASGQRQDDVLTCLLRLCYYRNHTMCALHTQGYLYGPYCTVVGEMRQCGYRSGLTSINTVSRLTSDWFIVPIVWPSSPITWKDLATEISESPWLLLYLSDFPAKFLPAEDSRIFCLFSASFDAKKDCLASMVFVWLCRSIFPILKTVQLSRVWLANDPWLTLKVYSIPPVPDTLVFSPQWLCQCLTDRLANFGMRLIPGLSLSPCAADNVYLISRLIFARIADYCLPDGLADVCLIR